MDVDTHYRIKELEGMSEEQLFKAAYNAMDRAWDNYFSVGDRRKNYDTLVENIKRMLKEEHNATPDEIRKAIGRLRQKMMMVAISEDAYAFEALSRYTLISVWNEAKEEAEKEKKA